MSAPDFDSLEHAEYGKPLRWWRYSDSFAVARFITRRGRSVKLSAVHNGHLCYWHRPQAWWPLYGLKALREYPETPVLVVQSEEAADAARGLFPDHVCITWPGGPNAVNQADIEPLVGRDVILWRDNDMPSLTAMARFEVRLGRAARAVAKVEIPAWLPNAWHLGRSLPAGVTVEMLRGLLRTTAATLPPRPAASPPHLQTSQSSVGGEEAKPPSISDNASPAVLGPDAGRSDQRASGEVKESAPDATEGPAPRADQGPVLSAPPVSRRAGTTDLAVVRPVRHPERSEGSPATGDSISRDVSPGPVEGAPDITDGSQGDSNHIADDWAEADASLLDDQRIDPPALPLDVLPSLWRSWAGHAARQAGAPVDYSALSLLAVAASLIGSARRISPVPAWREPCVLWTALVGAPGSGSTRGMDTALDLLRTLDTTDGAARRQHAAWQEWSRKRAQVWRQKVHNTAMCSGATPPPLPPEAIEPAPPRQFVTEDHAVASVVRLLRGNPRGILLAPDALADWLAHTARQRSGIDRRHWLRSWSARPWAATCYRQLTVDIPSAAVSILGRLQPGMLAAARTGNDDMLARFLFISPRRQPLQALAPASEDTGAEILATLSRLRDLPEAPRDVPLSPDALAAFEQFRRVHDEEAGKLEGRDGAWWSRGPAMVLRLAGVLTFLAWAARPARVAEPAQVPAGAIRAAASLWQGYLWPHARLVFAASGDGDLGRHVDKVREWLATHGLLEVSREQIRREALSQEVNAAGADAIIAALVDGGWLQPTDRETKGSGRPRRRWRVNTARWQQTTPAISATTNLPPEGEGAPKGRKGDVGSDAMLDARIESDRAYRVLTVESDSAISATINPPPEGEGAPQGRKGDARPDSVYLSSIDAVPASPFRRFAPPSPSGGKA